MANLQPEPESVVEWLMLMESQPEPKSVVEWLMESQPEPDSELEWLMESQPGSDLVAELEPETVVHEKPEQLFPEFCCTYDFHKQWEGLSKPVKGHTKTYSAIEELDGESWTGERLLTPPRYGYWIWYRRFDHSVEFLEISLQCKLRAISPLQCKSRCYTSSMTRIHPDDYIFFFSTLGAADRFRDQFYQITTMVPFSDEESTDEEDSVVGVTSPLDGQGSHSSGDGRDCQPAKDAEREQSTENSNVKTEHGEVAEAEPEKGTLLRS